MTSPPDDILDLLVAYALDALEPDEIARVSVLLQEQPELRSTLAELRASVDQLPYALPDAAPPPELRQRVLDYATGRAAPARRGAPAGLAGRMRGWLVALGGLAAVAVLVAVVGWARLAGVQAELADTRFTLMTVLAERHELAQVLFQSGTVVRLEGDGSGTLVRSADGAAVLAAQLPQLQPGRVYQLWLIESGSDPVGAGTFTVDQQGLGLLTLPPNPQALASNVVAVTDEPDPGSLRPTTDPLILGEFPST